MTDTETTTFQVVYAGLRKLSGGKTGHWYMTLSGGNWGGFVKPLVAGARIGTLIEVQSTPDGKFFTQGPNGPRVLGAAEVDDEILVGWQIASDLVKTADARQATERRLVREVGQPFEDALNVLSAGLDKLPWHQRAAAVNMIVSRLKM